MPKWRLLFILFQTENSLLLNVIGQSRQKWNCYFLHINNEFYIIGGKSNGKILKNFIQHQKNYWRK